ncbi:protein YIP4 [Diplogelasinospora grovesii]|uniref:Protein YIP4 n=1 Tax=Diplogelasinospora grovesii TaxID=303347 RepID=A0AAN6N9L6_9PEZI|nr:protein YIP4 [Diplogelasinospora grovesii]
MDPRDQTFMTIHNLTPDANILFASESIYDILGYQPDEVQGKSCFDYFHPAEVPFARSVHSRGVLLDKAAVLHYARILSRDGRWVSCECCFTIVHDVLVACTSIYLWGEKSSRRAMEAPQIRRLFSSSPRDPRYHMLEHLSPKFKMPPMEREPRAALILNRFTRNLSIMFATNAVTSILGLQPEEIKDKAFYECIQANCLQDAIQCLESAKANESIAYLRFWFRDPRVEENEEDYQDEQGDYEEEDRISSSTDSECGGARLTPLTSHSSVTAVQGRASVPPHPRRRRRTRESFELEAVVSCTSDGLVVVLRRARPPIPDPQPPLMPPLNFENGLFAAPWGLQPIEPYIPPELLYTFRPPLLPQYMPLRQEVKAAGGPPIDQLMRSIRDVAVFAWALVGINGNMANYSHGLPRGTALPPDGLPIWDPNAAPTAYRGPENSAASRWTQADEDKSPVPASARLPPYPHNHSYPPLETAPQNYAQARQPAYENYTHGGQQSQQSLWPRSTTSFGTNGYDSGQHPHQPQSSFLNADLNDFDDPLHPASSSRAPLTGHIGSSSSSAGPSSGAAGGSGGGGGGSGWMTSRIPGEDRRAPTNTIDESVWETLRRDLLAVWSKMREVLYPKYLFGGTMFESEDGLRGAYAHLRGVGLSGAREELAGLAGRVMDPESLLNQNNMSPGLRDWDLWGPLIFCLSLASLLSFKSRAFQREIVFSGVFAIVWIGEAVVTLQIKLLGGNISFAQSVCIIGYTLFPLVIAALLSAVNLYWVARIPVYLLLVCWSMAAGVSILGGSGVVKNRVGLAVYPLFVFYLGLGCLCFIS